MLRLLGAKQEHNFFMVFNVVDKLVYRFNVIVEFGKIPVSKLRPLLRVMPIPFAKFIGRRNGLKPYIDFGILF